LGDGDRDAVLGGARNVDVEVLRLGDQLRVERQIGRPALNRTSPQLHRTALRLCALTMRRCRGQCKPGTPKIVEFCTFSTGQPRRSSRARLAVRGLALLKDIGCPSVSP